MRFAHSNSKQSNTLSNTFSVNNKDTEQETYSKACQTSKIEHFAKIFNGFKPFIIFAKPSILDV